MGARDRVIERIKGDLAQVNRFTPGVHDVYAQILGARFATLASQMGVTPEEIAKTMTDVVTLRDMIAFMNENKTKEPPATAAECMELIK